MSVGSEEEVMTVPTQDVQRLFGTRNWVGSSEGRRWVATGTFVLRGPAETDPSQKQIIPYVVLASDGKIYSYARGKVGTESRLHAKRSIGIGGHVNPCDAGDTLAATVRQAAGRELGEEIGSEIWASIRGSKCIGLVNDDSDAVGQVHVGVCFLVELYTVDIEPREAALRDGRWCSIDELRADIDRYETWSQIVIRMIGGAA